MSKKLKIFVDIIAIPVVLSIIISTAIYGMNYFNDNDAIPSDIITMMASFSCTDGDSTLGCM